MFRLIFSCFEHFNQNSALILPVKEMAVWPSEEIAFLKKLGILIKATPARIVECPGCEEFCQKEVTIYPAQNEKPPHIFIPCDERDDVGRVPVKPSALEQWQIDLIKLASLTTKALGINDPPEEIMPQQVFYLGRCTIKDKRRSVIFIVNNSLLKNSFKKNLFGGYPYPVFLVGAGLQNPEIIDQGWIALPLQRLMIFSVSPPLSMDMEAMEYLISFNEGRALEKSAQGEKDLRQNIFKREGQLWTLCYGGKTIHLNPLKGLKYISYLLGSPFQDYHVAELVKCAESPEKEIMSFSSGEILTKETITNYRKRLSEIRNSVSEIEGSSDLLVKKELLEEKAALENQLLQAIGFGGKPKEFSNETKKQANSVSEAITRSMKKIETNHPSLWRHLFNAINRGEFLSYTPDTDTAWITI